MINLVAIATVKNEIDIVEAFVRHTLAHASRLVILDNGSSDGTLEVLHALANEGLPVTIVQDNSLGHYLSQRMTRLMREYAVERYGADWVLPLDADEFVAVPGGGPLVVEGSSADRPIAVPWRSYVPDPTDDPSQLNPVVRIRNRAVDGCEIVKVLVPRKLAGLSDTVLMQGSHELKVGAELCASTKQYRIYLAHFPIRSPGQYLAKIVLKILQHQVMTVGDAFSIPASPFRKSFDLLKRDPRAFLASYTEDARRYLMLQTAKTAPALQIDPFPYRGGPLRYTPAVDDMALCCDSLLTYAEDLARKHGILARCQSEDGRTTSEHCAGMVASLRTNLDTLVDQLNEKESVIQDQHRQLVEKERFLQEQNRQLVEKERFLQEQNRQLVEKVRRAHQPQHGERSWKRTSRSIVASLMRPLLHPLGEVRRVGSRAVTMAARTLSVENARQVVERALPQRPAETSVQALYDSLSAAQRAEICFDWDCQHPVLGRLRTFVANHWQITRPVVRSDFFTKLQQGLIHDIFRKLLAPDWYPKFLRQIDDDCKGHPWGTNQSIALFGTPGCGPFQFVITGRHLTLRADGNSEGRIAFGGPIFYGHAASGYHEFTHHPGNIFWPQAQRAGQLYQMLDGRQRRLAVVDRRPKEPGIEFPRSGAAQLGIPVTELTEDQKQELNQVLQVLVEPFRRQDQRRVWKCLRRMGGLKRCTLAYFREGNLGGDEEWDNWRLTGPAFAWYFRGTPHVHVWVHVANDPSVPLNAANDTLIDPSHDPLS